MTEQREAGQVIEQQRAAPARAPVAYSQQGGLVPTTLEEAYRMANLFAQSGMVPKAYNDKPEACFTAMQMGAELGLKPLQALQNIAVINGKPGIYGDLGKALLLQAGCIIDEDDISIVEKNHRARCKIIRPGRPPVERTFSVDNAKVAGLWGKDGPWKTYPWRQMAWRAFWFAARDAAADLLKGMSGAEELVDIPPERDITSESTAEIVPQPQRRSAQQDPAADQKPIDPPPVEPQEPPAAPDVEATPAEASVPEQPEDTGPGALEEPEEPAEAAPPASGPLMSETQKRLIKISLERAALSTLDLRVKFGELDTLKATQFNAVNAWIKDPK